jgi:uncharacterized membrane protein
MTGWIASVAATALVFLVLDALWLGKVARGFYRLRLGPLLAPRFRAGPAVAFYALYVTGLQYFAISGATSPGAAALEGALFGLFCYATYDLTNWATLRDFPGSLAVVDTAWGTGLSAAAAAAGALARTAAG